MTNKEMITDLFKLRLDNFILKESAATNDFFCIPGSEYPDVPSLAKEFSDNLLNDVFKVYENENTHKPTGI